MVKQIKGDEYQQAIGWYSVFKRSELGMYVAKIVSVDMESRVMSYEVMSGPYKGKRRSGRFVPGRAIKIYNEFALVKALLQTKEK